MQRLKNNSEYQCGLIRHTLGQGTGDKPQELNQSCSNISVIILFVGFTKAFGSRVAVADHAWNGFPLTLRQAMVWNSIKVITPEVRITSERLSNKKGVQETGRWNILSPVLVGTHRQEHQKGPEGVCDLTHPECAAPVPSQPEDP